MTEFPETDASLLVQIKSHDDREAWEEFVSLYRPVIYRIARRRGLQEADAQDLTQRVLTSVANSIHRWKKIDATVRFRHWLRRVVKNGIINAAARKRPDAAVGGGADHELLIEHVVDPKSEREIELEYRREIFKQAAAIVKSDVDPGTWRAFELTVIEDRPVEEVAETLGKSVGSIYAARSRMMRRLKVAVKQMEGIDVER